ncbi:MAG: GNAT family N-acetyltransferase [Promethearchaeota archaeon]
MTSFRISELKLDDIVESIKTVLLSFGRTDFEIIPEEEKTWIFFINNGIAKFHIVKLEKKIIGVGGLYLFNQVGSVGHMGVLPNYRGQGIGTAIFKSLMDTALKSKIKTVILFASNLGEPIYKNYGFRGTYSASRYRFLNSLPKTQIKEDNINIINYVPKWVLKLDKLTMGYDRSDYFKARISLGAKLLTSEFDGYAVLSNARFHMRLGPLVSKSPEIAWQIIKKGIGLGVNRMIIPDHESTQYLINRIAHITEDKGPPNLRMVYGEEIQENLDNIYSFGTFAKG